MERIFPSRWTRSGLAHRTRDARIPHGAEHGEGCMSPAGEGSVSHYRRRGLPTALQEFLQINERGDLEHVAAARPPHCRGESILQLLWEARCAKTRISKAESWGALPARPSRGPSEVRSLGPVSFQRMWEVHGGQGNVCLRLVLRSEPIKRTGIK